MEFSRREAKAWARSSYIGLEGALMPSFTPDMERLDEDGIRHDVDHYIRHGMFSILAAVESTAMTMTERCEFLRIVCDEARGRILVSAPTLLDTFAQDVEMLRYFASVGGDHVLLGCPVQYRPDSEEEMFETMRAVSEATDLAIDIYPAARFDMSRFGKGTLSVETLKRLADLDTVVGVKVGNLNPPNYFAHVYAAVGDRLLVQDPLDSAWAFCTRLGQQWAGAMGYDMWQTPDDQRVVRMFDLFRADQLDEAMELYWAIEPVRAASWAVHARLSSAGLYPFLLFKYQQWLVGGNGGMLRQPIHRPLQADLDMLRDGLAASGITPYVGPLEEFFVGRAAYARGARLPRGAAAIRSATTAKGKSDAQRCH
ncbi:dihydrodipicolinate synthase family protein [Sphingomonas sp. MMS24-J13]|uniref:dihydrodipicolinate synthase family protein n=1 Tax=Sphingomonas sp. MMS24-J13 TaxID=3238686 RepID=UPI00384F833F